MVLRDASASKKEGVGTFWSAQVSECLERRLSTRPTETELLDRNILRWCLQIIMMTWIVEIEMVPCKIRQFQTHLWRGKEKRQGGNQEVATAKTELQVTLAKQVPSQCLFKFDRPCVAELRKRRILQFSDYIEVLPPVLKIRFGPPNADFWSPNRGVYSLFY